MRSTLSLTAAFALTLAFAFNAPARACGCFTPPDPTVSILQAGEQIVFAADGQHVTAHVKIQYAGNATDFGWLVPLPSVPTIALSTDELFTQIETATQPVYQLTTIREACGGFAGSTTESSGSGGCGAGGAEDVPAAFDTSADGGSGLTSMNPNPVLVAQDSVGPYDFAVLKADDKTALLAWLTANHYFVPATNNDVIAPYLHPGAFFLALRLKPGRTVGDLQPIALTYDSDLPMIPIVLTSAGAQQNLGIEAFVLGSARAIPRNYYSTVLDDMAVDWSGNLDYTGLVIRAVNEAQKHHTFVTEYAGASSLLDGTLAPPGRFGDLDYLRQLTDAWAYVSYLIYEKYPFNPVMYEILERYIPAPADVIAAGVTPAEFYQDLNYYLGAWQTENAGDAGVNDAGVSNSGVGDGGIRIAFDPVALTGEINTRIVQPTQAAEALFHTFPMLTRLYTTLSPEDMTEDPVFSFNPDLPNVQAEHDATIDFPCGGTAYLKTQGFSMTYPGGRAPSPFPTLPASLRIETLGEAGPPTEQTNNSTMITGLLVPYAPQPASMTTQQPSNQQSSAGCAPSCAMRGHGLRRGDFALIGLVGIALLVSRRRRARA